MKYIIPLIIVFSVLGCARNTCQIGSYGVGYSRLVSGEVVRPLIHPNSTDTGYVNISYEFYNELDSTFKDSINNFISNYVQRLTEFEGEDYVSPLSVKFFENQADSFLVIYEGEVGLHDEDNSYSIGGVWDLDCSIGIVDRFETFVELMFSEWSYTGGAHGNGAYAIHIFNKEDGVLLGLEDFFSDINELNKICEPYFRKIMELGPEDNLGEAGFWFDNDQFSVNNNFAFGGDVVTFHYNTYEIAPYAGGPTDLEIPISKIKHLLKRDV